MEAMDESALDRALHGRRTLALAFLWGIAEATLFFIVPDVLLTLVGTRSLKRAALGTVFATLGAILGGAAMYTWAVRDAPAAREALLAVPGIQQELVDSVGSATLKDGSVALLFGPLRGRPYKIYAVENGARGVSVFHFLATSIPARALRFLLTALLACVIARALRPLIQKSSARLAALWATAWIAFYAFYFSVFGW